MPHLHSLNNMNKRLQPRQDSNLQSSDLMPYPLGQESMFGPQPKQNLPTTITNDNGDTLFIIFLLFF